MYFLQRGSCILYRSYMVFKRQFFFSVVPSLFVLLNVLWSNIWFQYQLCITEATSAAKMCIK
ncbi:hypothetical protein KUCAC02_002849 [Chaenocephalus aceratus]|uniref:Uncharacterized protein n=1 Tax=Chaenocephalus aceratus TaxID=36190 RepID=A0ACB9WJT3_CHAAC|nr:hypothetical protein KUCAC02_002849 [Chaenocephalus aceratus]